MYVRYQILSCWHRHISIYLVVKYFGKVHIDNYISTNCDYLCLWDIISIVTITKYYYLVVRFLCNMSDVIFILSSNTFVKQGFRVFLFRCS